ncbi:hypothetical protein [Microvirga rosea]|uniref:hypothetical protein n=1 Tax=Microvirga rosea TaxID=2715425 RepID=UPI001D0BC115|nr:hypothetical protein [Microvirga rosea]MCB8822812.1 hypothetical protein [Microvirga rosea]
MTDAAEAKIRQAHAEIRRANSEVDRLSSIIADLKTKLAVEVMHAVGLLAQVRAVKVLLVKVAPSNPLFARTGKAYFAGSQTEFGASYDEAFDAKGGEFGIPDPARFRKAAK